MVASCLNRGSNKNQVGQPQIFQNWRRILVSIIFFFWGLVIGGRDYMIDIYIYE